MMHRTIDKAGSAFFLLVLLVLTSQTGLALEVNMPMTQADSGNYYVEGRLAESIDASFLLDTGSGYVTLSEKTFAKLRRTTGAEATRHIRGRMANGSTVTAPVYELEQIKLAGCTLKDIEAVVMPGAERDILGLSALRQLQPFTVHMDPPVLSGQC